MNWQPYIKASWELVMASQGRTQVFLRDDLEAYLVNMMARNFTNKNIPPDIICLEFPKARNKNDFQALGDSCLFVDAWRIKPARLVNADYYERMGQMAYSSAALASRPIDGFFSGLAQQFRTISRVLAGVRQLANTASS
jgi:hypothetical protein